MESAVITGSTRGLGLAMAKCLLNRGHPVTITGRSQAGLDKAAQTLSGTQTPYLAVVCDVTDPDQIANLWHTSQARWGSVHLWVNNAGMNQTPQAMWKLSPTEVIQVIQTNLTGTILGCRQAAAGMIKQRAGTIYNVAGFGSDGEKRLGLNLYGTSKRSLPYFTQALSQELKPFGVKVGLLHPGLVVTDLVRDAVIHPSNDTSSPEAIRRIFNILGDKPETVAHFLVQEMLKWPRTNQEIRWLPRRKILLRFLSSLFSQRDLFHEDS